MNPKMIQVQNIIDFSYYKCNTVFMGRRYKMAKQEQIEKLQKEMGKLLEEFENAQAPQDSQILQKVREIKIKIQELEGVK